MKRFIVLISVVLIICLVTTKSDGVDVYVDCNGSATVIPDIIYVDVGQTVTWTVDVLCENLFCLGPPTFFNIYVPAGLFGEEWRSEQFLISDEIPVTSPTVVNCASSLMYSVGFWDLIEPVCGAVGYIDTSGDDSDCDGIPNRYDNCTEIANSDQTDTDGDCIGDLCDSDPLVYDTSQPDTYPPGGNNCGDACECEGNFDNDADQDGTDAATFKLDFGRSPFNNPCDGVDLFVTGGSGTILHYDGSIWTQMETGTTQSLRDVWGTSEKDIFAVGGSASLHYNGTSWSPIAIDTNSYLLDVWGAGANDVFATGWDGDIFHYNGTSWTQMDSGGTYFLYGIWGSAGDDVFVASYDGFIYHYNGTSWESMTSGTTQDLYAVGGTSANDVFAIGGNGTILHYEGTSWEAMNSGTTDSLYEIWGAAPDDIYVVGSFGTILHYDGASWLPENSGTTTGLNGIWGSGPENIFAVGDQCTILHYDGANWSYVPDVPYVTSSLTGVWGISAPYCKGDFDCDNDVDGSDAALFKQDFGRSEFNNPCPACVVGEWCVDDIGGCEENCEAELDMCLLGCEELPPESRDVCNDNCVFDYQYNCIPACGT